MDIKNCMNNSNHDFIQLCYVKNNEADKEEFEFHWCKVCGSILVKKRTSEGEITEGAVPAYLLEDWAAANLKNISDSTPDPES